MKKPLPKSYFYKTMQSPVGVLKLVGSKDGLAAILWEKEKPRRVVINIIGEDKKLPILLETEKQLKEYFVKKRTKFDLKLDWNGTTFQKKVWKALLNIPFGKTVSYADIAKKVGNPKAVRAVGGTNGRNPISIIAACHRVIGTSGKLTGYAGGMKAKAMLLNHEGGNF
jgi:methylated-DNA-[protein]-cysteine S-methyltransferase